MTKKVSSIYIDEKLLDIIQLKRLKLSQLVEKCLSEKLMFEENNSQKAEQLIKQLKQERIKEFLEIEPKTLYGKKMYVIDDNQAMSYWSEYLQKTKEELIRLWKQKWGVE